MMNHPAFCQKPNYHPVLSVTAYRALALQHRQAGFYNLTTLWYFRKAWLLSKKTSDYLRYLAFRRDLGFALTSHQRQRLNAAFRYPGAFTLWALLNPAEAELFRKFQQLPVQRPEPSTLIQRLHQAKTIQLVGNSAQLKHAQMGAFIDQADMVIRFNQCFSAQTNWEDTGQKTDLWVGAPNFKLTVPKAKDYVITGPDMLTWLRRLPAVFRPLQPLHSIPLAYWKPLVRQLAAPPSAGLLTCYWLLQQAPKAQIFVCGFDLHSQNLKYHHADELHQPVQRHHWQAERHLLTQWQQQQWFMLGCRERLN